MLIYVPIVISMILSLVAFCTVGSICRDITHYDRRCLDLTDLMKMCRNELDYMRSRIGCLESRYEKNDEAVKTEYNHWKSLEREVELLKSRVENMQRIGLPERAVVEGVFWTKTSAANGAENEIVVEEESK